MTITFLLLLFIVAILYASVGHGGASGYLALMALYEFSPNVMKPTALILNLFVSLTSFILYYRGGHFRWRLFLPFALASIPFSFLGGSILLNVVAYKKILGLLLLIPAFRFFIQYKGMEEHQRPANLFLSVLIGATIGFLSGLIGIGGGILLSPVLLFLHWSGQKQTAAVSALFIFVNSASGLAGQFTKGLVVDTSMIGLIAVAFTGGCVGGWLGSKLFNATILQYVLGLVLLLASVKLIVT